MKTFKEIREEFENVKNSFPKKINDDINFNSSELTESLVETVIYLRALSGLIQDTFEVFDEKKLFLEEIGIYYHKNIIKKGKVLFKKASLLSGSKPEEVISLIKKDMVEFHDCVVNFYDNRLDELELA